MANSAAKKAKATPPLRVRELTRADVDSGLVHLELTIEPEAIEVTLEKDLEEAFPGDPSGPPEDVAKDVEMRAEIARRVRADDHWAYCTVFVTLRFAGMESVDSLGRCSYEDEKDFRTEGGYFDDMVHNCLLGLNQDLAALAPKILALVELA